MTWLWVVLVLVVLGATAAVAVGRGGAMARAYPDRREVRLPTDRPVGSEDLQHVAFSVVLRGYRMDEVDDVISRLTRDLAEREGRLAEREQRLAERESRLAEADDGPGGRPAGVPVEPFGSPYASPHPHEQATRNDFRSDER
ncbi:DivIVA domain-containing protein [Actinopolymorpha pittospori]|uniref:DivIVA domain-containing protein n=1 Tax=Actinopolymorpha pittospori TaxID=648752 RepID=A0A927NBJ6_9ACTN|nr:DivIVA domain-containing protein [Actinopolymorpha pittospori]MBE1611800.1 DivIVA domain-containing protein [Actinopolymorpha pittospori]